MSPNFFQKPCGVGGHRIGGEPRRARGGRERNLPAALLDSRCRARAPSPQHMASPGWAQAEAAGVRAYPEVVPAVVPIDGVCVRHQLRVNKTPNGVAKLDLVRCEVCCVHHAARWAARAAHGTDACRVGAVLAAGCQRRRTQVRVAVPHGTSKSRRRCVDVPTRGAHSPCSQSAGNPLREELGAQHDGRSLLSSQQEEERPVEFCRSRVSKLCRGNQHAKGTACVCTVLGIGAGLLWCAIDVMAVSVLLRLLVFRQKKV